MTRAQGHVADGVHTFFVWRNGRARQDHFPDETDMLCIARSHPRRSISLKRSDCAADGERESAEEPSTSCSRSLLRIYKVDLPPRASFSHIALAGLQCWCVDAALNTRITMWSTKLAVVLGEWFNFWSHLFIKPLKNNGV